MKASNRARPAISTQSPFFFSVSERRSEPHLHHDPTGVLPHTHLDGIPWWGRWSGSNLSLEPRAEFHGEPLLQGCVPRERTIWNLSRSQWWASFWMSALFTAWIWMSPLKQDQIYGQINCSDLGSLRDVWHWSKDWLCPHTRNFPSNTVRMIAPGNLS